LGTFLRHSVETISQPEPQLLRTTSTALNHRSIYRVNTVYDYVDSCYVKNHNLTLHVSCLRHWRRAKGGGHLLLPGNVVKCFCALVVTIKRSVHYFCIILTICRRLLGALPQTSTGDPSLDLTGVLLSPDTLICPPLEKILRAPMVSVGIARQDAGRSG